MRKRLKTIAESLIVLPQKSLTTAFAVIAGFGFGVSHLDAVTRNWTNPEGGSFHEEASWNPAGEPDIDDEVVFNLGAEESYEVTLSQDASTWRNVVRTDSVNLDLGGFTLEGTDTARGVAVGVFANDVGHLRVTNGILNTASFRVGETAGAIGTLIIGEGVQWTNSATGDNAATVGSSGVGTLIVEEGATADFARFMMGRNDSQPGSSATLIVRGAGSRVTTSAAFTGGLASEETSIQIEDGASLEVDGEFNLARRGHQATMIMDNASMVAHDWVRLAPLAPGAFPGVAEMILRNGSTLQMTAADRDLRLSEAVGTRTNLHVLSGSAVTVPQHLILDGQGGGEANLYLSGEGTTVDIASHLYVAWRENANATVAVTDGARLKIGSVARIGMGVGSQSSFTVSDAILETVNDVRVGKAAGATSQLILDSATATTGRIDLVGRGDGAVGEIFVRGGSTWNSNAEATIGNDRFSSFGVNGAGAEGSLIVEEGSVLSLTGEGAAFHIGASAGATGRVGIFGAGSRIEGDAFDLFVGGSRLRENDGGEPIGGVGGTGSLEALQGGKLETNGEIFVWETGEIRASRGGIAAGSIGFSENAGAGFVAVLGGGTEAPVTVAGNAVLGNGANLTVELAPGFAAAEDEVVDLIRFGGTLSGQFAGLPEGARVEASGFGFSIVYGENAVSLRALEDISVAGGGYEDWVSQFDLPAEMQAPDANPSGDGIANGVKYVLGLDPRTPSAGEFPVAEVTEIDGERYLSLRVEKDPEANALVTVEVSGDLENWESGPEFTTVLEETASVLHVRDNAAISESNKRFIRMRVDVEENP